MSYLNKSSILGYSLQRDLDYETYRIPSEDGHPARLLTQSRLPIQPEQLLQVASIKFHSENYSSNQR